jgi:transcriptional regulator GlxA family with amidase domain
MSGPAPTSVGFFLIPDFPMIVLGCAIDPLRIANRLAGRTLYTWSLISRDGAPVPASNRIAFDVQGSIAAAPACDMVFACAGLLAQDYRDHAVFAWLRKLHRQGVRLGALSTGTYLLARSGLLDGLRCTVHWENVASLAEDFPRLRVTDDIFVEDGAILTCSGGTGTIDAMLHLIAGQQGASLATAIADQIMHPRIRGHQDSQRNALEARLAIAHPKLASVVRQMQAALEEPLEIDRLARDAGLSPRHLERLCARHLGRSPHSLYLELRLERGRGLLQQTGLSVLDVALACGFVSATHFSRRYRACFGLSPTQERRGAAHPPPVTPPMKPASEVAAH